jgi:hypothetical protein
MIYYAIKGYYKADDIYLRYMALDKRERGPLLEVVLALAKTVMVLVCMHL